MSIIYEVLYNPAKNSWSVIDLPFKDDISEDIYDLNSVLLAQVRADNKETAMSLGVSKIYEYLGLYGEIIPKVTSKQRQLVIHKKALK